ncbi:MAG: N-6 DNA methylase, partial [Cyanobacteria bacterium NC_groundwater_1444_Ag_S-0.65um_54_12]|nr:N-6 DNA methylase [Cyanobacteria bacterium NC_groundwater_1444_Ag_S-0.65um_54_12]
MSPIGQIFTPLDLAAEIIAAIPALPQCILDPACGTGNLLVAAAVRWPDTQLLGFELDSRCVAIARGRLPSASIQVNDALTLPVKPICDLVIGNPPYAAAHRSVGDRARLRRQHHTACGSFDLSVPFIERCVGWLRPGGYLALVVTNKILVKDYAMKLRSWLQETLVIREIWDLAALPAFWSAKADAAVMIGQRHGSPSGGVRLVLGRRDGAKDVYHADQLPVGPRGRWEVYVTPAIASLV